MEICSEFEYKKFCQKFLSEKDIHKLDPWRM
jgi:hypothetical protein